jgi:hypothetical protein
MLIARLAYCIVPCTVLKLICADRIVEDAKLSFMGLIKSISIRDSPSDNEDGIVRNDVVYDPNWSRDELGVSIPEIGRSIQPRQITIRNHPVSCWGAMSSLMGLLMP